MKQIILALMVMATLSFGLAIGQRKPSLKESGANTRVVVDQLPAKSAPCRQPASRSCSLKGKPGQQTCDDGVWSACGKAKFIMTIEGVDSHPVELEISSFSFGPEKNQTGAAGGAAPRKPAMSDLQVSKQHDITSQKLFREALNGDGKLYRVNLRVDINDDQGHLLSRQQYWFSDASVSNYQESGVGPEATETITLHFANMYTGSRKGN